jgi:oligopeptide/dipeptide ABC transporter ATP-binding protein
MTQTSLLELTDVKVTFTLRRQTVTAVDGISLTLDESNVLGVVGESGSGKSVSMLAVLGLLPDNASVSGSIRFRGRELLGMPPKELRSLRGGRIGMIFQDPLSALNPVITIGDQLCEALRLHRPGLSHRAARGRAAELLELVAIADPGARLDRYPHEFSGGMRQRAMIAMAVANEPDLLIADEPTTALDVTVQAQILEVLERLKKSLGLALILITHDLGVIAGSADDVAVMYAGRIVEQGPVDEIYYQPRHPYTRGLLAALPDIGGARARRLIPIDGTPPLLSRRPSGCAFHPRCPQIIGRCREEIPALLASGPAQVACHLLTPKMEPA